MLRTIAAALSAVVVLHVPAAHAQFAGPDSIIRGLVAEQASAWNAGDGARYAKHVAADVSFTNLFGMVMYGSDAFTERHNQILSTFYKGTRKVHAVRRVQFVTPDVALVDIDNQVQGVTAMPAGIPVPPDGVIRTQLLEVFVRRAGVWWIAAYHNVDVKSSARP